MQRMVNFVYHELNKHVSYESGKWKIPCSSLLLQASLNNLTPGLKTQSLISQKACKKFKFCCVTTKRL